LESAYDEDEDENERNNEVISKRKKVGVFIVCYLTMELG
jgi:hypothetical protein